jgi:hypothetical protein
MDPAIHLLPNRYPTCKVAYYDTSLPWGIYRIGFANGYGASLIYIDDTFELALLHGSQLVSYAPAFAELAAKGVDIRPTELLRLYSCAEVQAAFDGISALTPSALPT